MKMSSGRSEIPKNTSCMLRDLLNGPQYATVILALAVFFLISAMLRFPFKGTASYYGDFVSTFWARSIGNSSHEVVFRIPYVIHMFENPSISDLVRWLGGWMSFGNVQIFAGVEFGVLLMFTILTANYLFLLMKELGLSYTRPLLCSKFAPSIIFYGAYIFDIIQTSFVVIPLYFFIDRSRWNWSALALGLAVSTKLSPALLLPTLCSYQTSLSDKNSYNSRFLEHDCEELSSPQ